MKTIIPTALLLLYASLALPQNSVLIGTNSFPASFSAGTTNSTLRQLMCEDLTRYLSYNPNPALVFKTNQNGSLIPLDEIVGSRHPDIVATNLFLDTATNHFGIIVGQPISEKYVDLLSGNADIQCMVTGAIAFVEMFNSGMVTNLPPGEKCCLFRTLDSSNPPIETNHISIGIEKYWIKKNFAMPSLMDFSNLPVWPNETPIPTFLIRTRSSFDADWPESTEFHIGSISNKWFFIAY